MDWKIPPGVATHPLPLEKLEKPELRPQGKDQATMSTGTAGGHTEGREPGSRWWIL